MGEEREGEGGREEKKEGDPGKLEESEAMRAGTGEGQRRGGIARMNRRRA